LSDIKNGKDVEVEWMVGSCAEGLREKREREYVIWKERIQQMQYKNEKLSNRG